MRTILEYQIPMSDTFTIPAPASAEFLRIVMKGDYPVLVAIVDIEDQKIGVWEFHRIKYECKSIDSDLRYIDSFVPKNYSTFEKDPRLYHLFARALVSPLTSPNPI